MTTLHDLPTPALLLDLEVLERNLDRMAGRADALGVHLRPHIKTHKCIEIGRLQRERGARGITVSTLDEARAFAAAGFDDMTWAFPVIPGRIEEASRLDGESARLRVLADGPEAVRSLEASGHAFHVWLKVDCGYGRAGLDPGGTRLAELADALASSRTLVFDGLLTHSGQAYHARGREALAAAAEQERSVMAGAAERLRSAGIVVPAVSVGSTPAMSAARSLEGVDEARPGNYAFYDYTQVVLGSCAAGDCALSVAATVVSSQPGSDHCVVDAGALALSSDPGPGGRAGSEPRSMGELFADEPAHGLRTDVRLVSLSQEHGIVHGRLPHGTRVRVLPNHSCLTAACFDVYHVVVGEEVVDRWPIHRERR
ncbi:MAG: alanine racemase [Candidatus Palauibacterales bacterium]|nr:alanine racemase [Candidatus Palauibacterales bacterium]MDP2529700.1 alanine racemase [Candidatus Palauibacterales bacterium]MDP2584116.1 alanine racemase [Candidatus Palauibacterales bacterium]